MVKRMETAARTTGTWQHGKGSVFFLIVFDLCLAVIGGCYIRNCVGLYYYSK